MGWVAAKRSITEWPAIVIDCPLCRASGAPAIPRLYEEPLLLLHLVPLFTLRSAFVECGACRQSLSIATRDLNSLGSMSREETSRLLQPYVSGVGRFLVVSALLLFWFPFLAPALSLGGWWMTRRHPRWRRLAIVSVVLSFVVAGAVAVLFLAT